MSLPDFKKERDGSPPVDCCTSIKSGVKKLFEKEIISIKEVVLSDIKKETSELKEELIQSVLSICPIICEKSEKKD